MLVNTEKLRKYNTIKIIEVLKELEYGTKNSLARLTGLSIGTCFNVITDLLEKGEIIEIEQSKPRGGRPSRRFVYNFNYSSHMHTYLIKEHKSKTLHYSIQNLRGDILDFGDIISTHFEYSSIEELVKEKAKAFKNLQTLTISVPGMVKDGYIYNCDFEYLSDLDLKKKLFSKFELDIRVENDVNTLAYGTLANNNVDNTSPAVYLYFPRNDYPGMGLIINNQVILGHNNFVGEFKDLPIKSNNKHIEDILEDNLKSFEYITDIVKTINSVINPGLITVSVPSKDSEFYSLLEKELVKIDHIGVIKFESDIKDTMLNGLNYLSNLLIQEV